MVKLLEVFSTPDIFVKQQFHLIIPGLAIQRFVQAPNDSALCPPKSIYLISVAQKKVNQRLRRWKIFQRSPRIFHIRRSLLQLQATRDRLRVRPVLIDILPNTLAKLHLIPKILDPTLHGVTKIFAGNLKVLRFLVREYEMFRNAEDAFTAFSVDEFSPR